MKFTVLSHAGMLAEHDGVSVLMDPWLVGSAYWRSWWNFPEPPRELIDRVQPDFIYLSHLHWDHFHGVSLRRFDRATTILVPKACTRRMVDDLNWLGFNNVREIPHGQSVKLGPDLSLHSFQFGIGLDSAVVLRGGGVTLFNTNDCKNFGLPLRHILRQFPNPDFVFRSHSSARALPYCIEGYETRFPHYRAPDDYIEEFSRFALHVGARYAIPFASNHCFLHKETLRFNDTAVNPARVAERCNALAAELGRETECVVMPPGSSWGDREGFRLREFDYSKKAEYVERMQAKHGDKLEASYRDEARELADFDAFRTYFTGFLEALPFPVRRKMLKPFVIRTIDPAGDHHWMVDPRTGAVSQVPSCPPDAFEIETSAKILNDCTRLRMFSVWTASKRLVVRLGKDEQLKHVGLLFSLLDAYELDLLPLHKNLSPRSLGVYARRWREAVEAGRLVFETKLRRKPMDIKALFPLPAVSTSGAPTGRGTGAASDGSVYTQ